MESADLITENRPIGRVVRKKPADRNPFGELKRMVNGYTAKNFKEWFDIHRDEKLKRNFERMIVNGNEDEEEIGDGILEVYRDEFIEDLTNRWNEPKCPNFFKQYKLLNVEFSVRDFIKFWKDCCEWFDDAFGDEVKLETEEQAWNCICFWVFQTKLMDDWEELFTEKFKEEFCEYRDNRNRTSRIPCGVCYENKILFTGCSCCNGNYLCHSCYDKIDNECPFCRCETMICPEPLISVMNNDDFIIWIDKMKRVLKDIPLAVENAVIDQCEKCKKDIRWRDGATTYTEQIDYDGDDRYITCEMIICLKCCKKSNR